MIVKSEAVEPKAGSATSVYPAVIVNILNIVTNEMNINLQVFCPSVMSGDIFDAKNCQTNWIKAPRYPHTNAEPYNYQIGGIVMISYQNGNVDSPLFVRFVVVSDEIIRRNASYVKGADITVDSLFDVSDTSLTLTSPGIQKGVALLPALQQCRDMQPTTSGYTVFHTYCLVGGDRSILRCGSYGIELVEKFFTDTGGKRKAANYIFTYTDTLYSDSKYSSNSSLAIFKYLINMEVTNILDVQIIDLFNETIKETETNSNLVTKFDKTNNADILYIWSLVAGLIYNPNESEDMSSVLLPTVYNEIVTNKLKHTEIKINSNFEKIVGAMSRNVNSSIYQGAMGYTTSNGINNIPAETQTLIFTFIDKLWTKISENSELNTRIASRYAIILTNNLASMKRQYNCKTMANVMLIILTVICSTFRVIEPILTNISLNESYFNDETVLSNTDNITLKLLKIAIIKNLKSDNYSKLDVSAEALASGFTKIYFDILNKGYSLNPSYTNYNSPETHIKSQMLRGINYIINNYDSLKTILMQNEDEE